MAIAVFGVWVFERSFIAEHYAPLGLVVVLYVLENVIALWRYGRLSSFHTILCRVAAYAQGIFVMSLFLFGYEPWLFDALIGISVLAYLEELVLVFLVRPWRPDVRGLYWVLHGRSPAP